MSAYLNNKKYYEKVYADPEKAEKRRQYYKKFREKHKERLSEERRVKYAENREKFSRKAKEWRDNSGGKLAIRKDGLTQQEYRTQINFINKIKALQKVCGKDIPECCKCKETDIKVLSINHINGGGNAERINNKHANVAVDVLKNRSVEDLDVRCFNCNIRYEYEQNRRFTPVQAEEIYKKLCIKE